MIYWYAAGVQELRLIYQSKMRSFPAPDQRIFCPVLNEWHARSIAEDTSRRHDPYGSFVLRFRVDDAYASTLEPHTVRREHEELWIMTEQIGELNEHLESRIELVAASFGPSFRGHIPDRFGLRDMDATQQFVELVRMLPQRAFDFRCEVAANHAAVFVNFAYWCRDEFLPSPLVESQKLRTLELIRVAWNQSEHRKIPLGLAAT
jgi:hypothetical protein